MIRQLRKDELGLLAELGRKAFGKDLFLFNARNPLYTTARVLGWFFDKSKQLIAVRVTHQNLDDKKTMYVDYIMVLPEYQDRKVAEELSEYGTRLEVGLGVEVFHTTINPWNARGCHYVVEKIGGRVVGVDPNKKELLLIERDIVLNKFRNRDEEKNRDEKVVVVMGGIPLIGRRERQQVLSRIQDYCNSGLVGVSYDRENASFLFVRK